ncbi:DUF998 domain-containing protein [Yinghuangia seranimata]|uniref:DUF998 domain-containing protein n=1 Tax=Yinghuangia seranimata TaxID=408067 RepID=UPI00248C9B2F|nr:DUF998 domain-containing protein [Yinghuangia seranimata]MDI2130999.1 DUF998 domain-containing protein [Yinghuangia seranimata]
MITPRSRLRPAVLLLAVGAVAYSSWILEIALPTRLSTVNGFASELFAADQPYRWVFGGLDIVAGVCAALAAVLVLSATFGPRPAVRWAYLGWAALAVFGVATVLDVVFPLDCAPSLAGCKAREQAGRLSFTHDVHLVTSVVANIAALVAICALWRAARAGTVRPSVSRTAGAVLFWIALAATLTTTLLSLHDMRVDVPAFLTRGQGVPQRVQVGLIALWMAVAAASLRRGSRTGRDDGARTGTSGAGSGRTTWQSQAAGRRVSSSVWTASSSTPSDRAAGLP